MDFPDVWHEDTAKCDFCGTPTPRLYPPRDLELCDSCFRDQEQAGQKRAEQIVANNEEIYMKAVQAFFGLPTVDEEC